MADFQGISQKWALPLPDSKYLMTDFKQMWKLTHLHVMTNAAEGQRDLLHEASMEIKICSHIWNLAVF